MNNEFEVNIIADNRNYKKDIRKAGANSGKMLLILSLVTYLSAAVIAVGLHIIFQKSNAIDKNTIIGVSKDSYTFFMGYLPCIIGDIAAIIAGLYFSKISLKRDVFCKSSGSFNFVILSSVSCIAVGMISSTIYLIYSAIIENQGLKIPAPDFSMPSQNLYIFLFFMYTCVIAPIFEEVIFRGIILKQFLKYGNLCAIVVSSILFSMFHFNLVQFVNPILMGIVFSFIVIKTHSVKCSIIAHMFNNSLILLTTVLANYNNSILEYLFSSVYLLGGFLGFIYFIKNYGEEFINIIKQKSIDNLSNIRKIVYSFTNVWILLYILLYIGLVSLTFFTKNTAA